MSDTHIKIFKLINKKVKLKKFVLILAKRDFK